MIYKNAELHNVGAILDGEKEGSIKWLRIPENVRENLETEMGKMMCTGSTGVELRFVMESDSVTLRMGVRGKHGVFHVYRGSIQGGNVDHEVDKILNHEVEDYIINKSDNLQTLRRITKDFSYPFSPEVVRVIFDRGGYELVDIIGDIRPPRKDEVPSKTLLAYGSSITHGSNSLDASHSWVSVLAHNLKMDCRNLGFAGSCCMEPEMIDYIAKEGEKGNWDIAVLELGINVLGWEEDKIVQRVKNVLKQVAGRNADKKIYVISPFYCNDDYNNNGNADKWRRLLKQITDESDYSNVTCINGLDLLGDMSYISADELHPNIYGVNQIAERLTGVIKKSI